MRSLLAAALVPLCLSAGYDPPRVALPRLQKPPQISRTPDLGDWAGAMKIDDFSMYMPHDQGQVPARTVAYLAWGPDALYIAFEAFDPTPAQLHAYPVGRDSLDSQDQVYVDLDPTGKGQTAIRLTCNALGQQADGLLQAGGMDWEDSSYDCLWDSAGVRTATGFVVKMRIPYTSLRRLPGAWGLRLRRAYPRDRAYVFSWPHQNRDIQGTLIQMARAEGAPEAAGHAPFLIIPFVAGSRQGSADEGNLDHPTSRGRMGLDLRYAGSALTLDATYRPDFSAVEADVDPLQINSRYKVWYPEKRPFFLEGMELFSVNYGFGMGPMPFFSRSIVEPEVGAKASGQADLVSWSVLAAKDQSGGRGMVGDGAMGTMGRATRDLAGALRVKLDPRGSHISFVGTDRSLLGGAEGGGRSGTLSMHQRFGEHVSLSLAGISSLAHLPQVDGSLRTLRGTSSFGSLSWNSRNWDFSVSNSAISPDLVLLSGFTSLTGYRSQDASASWTQRADKAWWTERSLWLSTHRNTWWDGRPMSRETELHTNLGLARQIKVEFNLILEGREFVGSRSIPTQGGGLEVSWSESGYAKPWLEFDYKRTADLETGLPALQRSLSAGSRGHLGGLIYSLRLNRSDLTERHSGRRIVEAQQVNSNLDYHFPGNVYLRSQFFITRYETPSGRSLDRYLRLMAGWRPNAFTQAYLGYAQRRNRDPWVLPVQERMTEQGWFGKFAYAYQF